MKVKMKWNKHKQIWMMTDCLTHRFLQEFFDCENIRKYFPDLDEKGDNVYTLIISKEVK